MKRFFNLYRQDLLPVLPVFLAPVILFADVLFADRALFWGLPSLQFIPWRWHAWEQLRQGILPLWNPLNGMGAPLAANYQLALFYPPGWLLYLLAALGGVPALAWGHVLLLVLHLAWAGLGMVLLLRFLGVSRLAQGVGGLAFGMCSYFVARNGVFPMIWAGAWLPWVVLSASRIAIPGAREVRFSGRIPWMLVVCLAFLLLAGHAQLAWYTIVWVAVWVWVGGWSQGGFKGALRAVGQLVLAGLLAGLVASIQLIPTAEYLLQSQRTLAVDYDLAMSYSYWPWRLIALIAPDFFGNPGQGNYWGYGAFWEDAAYNGLLPLFLALSTIGLVFSKAKNGPDGSKTTLVRFLWAVILVVFVLALGRNTPVFPFLYRYIPTFSMFQAPARWMLVIDFALAMLAGIGVEHWRTPTGRGLYWFRLSVMGAAAVTIGAGLAWFLIKNVELSFVPATAMAGVWALGAGFLTLLMPSAENKKRRAVWSGLVVAWVAMDLIAAGLWLHPTTASNFYSAESQTVRSIREAAGGGRVYIGADEEFRMKYARFLRFNSFLPIEDTSHVRDVMLPNLNLLEGLASTSNFDPLVPGRYSEWMKQLDRLSADEREPWLRLMGVGAVEQIDIWDLIGIAVKPIAGSTRWYWASCGIQSTSETQSLNLLKDRLGRKSADPDWVILERTSQDMPPACVPGKPALIQLVSEKPDALTFAVESDQPGWLVLADTWFPGWKATVGGSPAVVSRANDLFRAVAVEPGKHMVVFEYRPLSFTLGWILSLSGLILLALGIIKKRNWQ